MCEFNACRSQLAEALARALLPKGWHVLSAGLTRSTVSDEILAALKEIGIDERGLISKTLDELSDDAADELIVLEPRAAAQARLRFPSAQLHLWPMADPLRASNDPEEVRKAVRSTRDLLIDKIRHLRSAGK